MSTHEVTNGQFNRFVESRKEFELKGAWADKLRDFAPTANHPRVLVTWFEAAAYCNWLSQQEKIPPEQWCYPEAIGPDTKQFTMPKDYLRRTGYRLPTEAEWEYACRAGTTTARPFGDSLELLPYYARFLKPDSSIPVGQLKPNDLGLHDILGNAHEWVQDSASGPYRADPDGSPVDDVEGELTITVELRHVQRGGGFPFAPKFLRSPTDTGTPSNIPTTPPVSAWHALSPQPARPAPDAAHPSTLNLRPPPPGQRSLSRRDSTNPATSRRGIVPLANRFSVPRKARPSYRIGGRPPRSG